MKTRPLDGFASALTLALCIVWGFNQVVVKSALPEIGPIGQTGARSAIGVVCVVLYAVMAKRRIFLFDGSETAGALAGLLFTAEFIALLRKFAMPAVFTDHARYPNIADITGDFVYARLQRGKDSVASAYPPKEIDAWAKRLYSWAAGGEPDDLPRVAPAPKSKPSPRDVFAYVIHEGKIRAPAGAMALIAKLTKV